MNTLDVYDLKRSDFLPDAIQSLLDEADTKLKAIQSAVTVLERMGLEVNIQQYRLGGADRYAVVVSVYGDDGVSLLDDYEPRDVVEHSGEDTVLATRVKLSCDTDSLTRVTSVLITAADRFAKHAGMYD